MRRYQITQFVLLASFAFQGCDVADVPGMFLADYSVNQRFEQSAEWNLSHLSEEVLVASDDYQIFAMGDSHVGGTVNLDSFLLRAIVSGAQAVVMAGDLTTGHAEDYEVFQQQLSRYESLPAFLIPGNHDLYFEGWEEFYARFGSSAYFFIVNTPEAKDLHICLDSGGGTLGSQQLDWFREVLKEIRPAYRHCIVYTHNNLFRFRRTMSTNPNVEELRILLTLFSDHHVDMVVTGHDHKRYDQMFGNTTHIVMDALKDGLSNAGFLSISVEKGKLTYRFHTIP